MKLIFRGDPNELQSGGALSRQSLTLEGVFFPMNVAVDASSLSERLKAKLKNNGHFEVVEDAAPAAPAAEEPAPPAEGDDTEEADERDEAAEVAALQARLARKPPARPKSAKN